jgi:predicted flap endonuclease-1-like 5' DNA nuclease
MERAECSRNNWIVAAIAGVVVLLFVSGIGDLHWLAGLFLGAVTFVLFGATLIWLTCHETPELFADDTGQTGTDWQREMVDRQPESLLVGGALGPDLAAEMPIMAGAVPAPAPAASAGAAKPAPAKAKPEPAPAKPAAGKKTRKAPPDDLKRIKGIGPKLSDWLHENGITRYAQIAAWDAATVADFAQRLGRMGNRIEADDWVGQAKLLAAGGETEFSHRVDDGEVY